MWGRGSFVQRQLRVYESMEVVYFPLQASGTSDFTGAQGSAVTSTPGCYIDSSASLVIFRRGDY